MLAEMAKLPPRQALFCLILAWTGARVSEILALTPSSFQTERGIVALQTLKRRKHHVREVPIPPDLMAALDRSVSTSWAKVKDLNSADHRLWPWCRATAWRLIRRQMHLSGIIGRHACPRGLRHAFGVGTLQAGVPLNLTQRWLGHARIGTTVIYAAASGPRRIPCVRSQILGCYKCLILADAVKSSRSPGTGRNQTCVTSTLSLFAREL